MADINRYFEFMDKEDVIKKMVSMEFGRFLAYYADAPEIENPAEKRKEAKKGGGKDRPQAQGKRGGAPRKAEAGYRRLFINLGKTDGFYPGEVMQFINRHVKGRQEVGHIDLKDKFSYIEVPERDARRVMAAIDGTVYKGRAVRCNDADQDGASPQGEKASRRKGKGEKRPARRHDSFEDNVKKDDWRQFFRQDDMKLKGEEPDFSEEGWARRKPKKS